MCHILLYNRQKVSPDPAGLIWPLTPINVGSFTCFYYSSLTLTPVNVRSFTCSRISSVEQWGHCTIARGQRSASWFWNKREYIFINQFIIHGLGVVRVVESAPRGITLPGSLRPAPLIYTAGKWRSACDRCAPGDPRCPSGGGCGYTCWGRGWGQTGSRPGVSVRQMPITAQITWPHGCIC